MTRDQAIAILGGLRPHLERRGIAHVGVFGSVSRGAADPLSDVDVIATPMEGRRLDLIDLGAIQSLLDSAFGGLQVDLLVEPIDRSSLRQSIERERADAF